MKNLIAKLFVGTILSVFLVASFGADTVFAELRPPATDPCADGTCSGDIFYDRVDGGGVGGGRNFSGKAEVEKFCNGGTAV